MLDALPADLTALKTAVDLTTGDLAYDRGIDAEVCLDLDHESRLALSADVD